MLRSQAEAAATPPSGPAHRNTARAAKPPNRERARATELMPPRTIAVRAAAEGKACRRPRRWFSMELVRAGNARHLPLQPWHGQVSSHRQPAAVAGTAEQRAGGLNPVPCVWNTEKHQQLSQRTFLLRQSM